MRKLLVLLFAAAIIGIVISRSRGSEPAREPAAPGQPDPHPGAVAAPPGQSAVAAALGGAPAQQAPRAAEPAERMRLSAVTAEEPPHPAPAQEDAPAEEPADSARMAALQEGVALLKEGRFSEARPVLTGLYLSSRGELARSLRELLDYASRQTFLNPRNLEGAVVHVVQPGETLTVIGKKYGVNWRTIQFLNGMSTDRLSVGQQLKVPTATPGAVAVKSEFRMALLMDGLYVKEYGIGIGRDDLTPSGEFTVDSMLVRPRWYKPGGGIVEYGEEGHLLGERWIGFRDEPGATGLGIHGTNEEATIGTKCSNGCIRMRNEDVIEFYGFARVGMRVRVVE